ncbi:hypothetical protein RGU12_07545 [Fredinandcohnia sp. QZ13]|uniref:hypothetical protein n=1 Tax=Fredinandcohnia sp. QZ13 TaxID=3073144 RepID=UPI002853315E|nr:hypothetical protein [Fredinandcohnia sp. QZ13]MDR4887412.1 hypothetical protein [Fredinandcohnia sp. QZ13]
MSNKINQELERIEIPKELHERSKLGVMNAKSEKTKSRFKKLAIPLVASVFVVFSAGVGAARIPSFNNLVATVSPQIAIMLQPIEISSESEGIKMEVVAAMNDHEMAVIYVTLQDFTSNRIDETLDLYDYSLTGAQMFNSRIVDYDEKTNTATLRIQANGGESLNERKVNFRITSFLSDKQTYEIAVDANLSEITSKPPQTVRLDMNNIPGGGGNLYQKLEEQGVIQVLKPNETEIILPEIEFMHVSNIGIIDNRLHVQTRWNKENIDNHGYFYIADDLGNTIHPTSISFGIDEEGQTNYGNEYTEYIFDIDSVDFEKTELLGHFVSNGKYTTGNWNTTFKMEAVQDEINSELNKNFGTWSSNRVSISPLGITIYGTGKFNDSSNIAVSAKMTDGSVQTFDSMFNYSDNKGITIKFASPLPLELSKVKTINVNDTEISLK